jgi:rhamnosyltransferase subunit B
MEKNLNAVVMALGSAGDVHPMVGLGLALRRRGHGVLFVAPMVFKPLECGRNQVGHLGSMSRV